MSVLDGVTIIKKYLETMPNSPGVYRMLDKHGKVLYVGKAKNLPKRVINYTRPEKLGYRIQAMISNTHSMEIVTTETETEALLLEANLIKKFEPKYNILLRDDKSFPYILITANHDYPRITKHRGAQKQKGSYYGPFASAGAVNASIAYLQKAFLIRPCTDSFFKNRTRPCMEYQIKRCSAPCVDKISKKDYSTLIQQVKDFLNGKNRQVQEQLIALMNKLSKNQEYEKAAIYRDRISALNHIQAKQIVNVKSLMDTDVIGLYQQGDHFCVQIFFFRSGQNFGNRALFPKNTEDQSIEEVLHAFLLQFYQTNPPPKEIVLSHKITELKELENALSSIGKHTVNIAIPQKGDKKSLIDNAIENAQNSLKQHTIKAVKHSQNIAAIEKLFGLTKPIERIEVYDNSHIMGTNEVGAMIVANRDGFNKKAYRKFNIKSTNAATKGDDYAMMEEVLTRRFKRLKNENAAYEEGIWPDLVLIDGGAGHLTIAEKVFHELGLTEKIIFACISKGPDRNAGREKFHLPEKKPFTLPHSDPAMHYLQILRDEAHNYAIGSHRQKRAKSTFKSSLDEIPGIGAKRKKMLINHFGSADSIKSASVKDLQNIDGISKHIAQKIYDFYRS